VIRRSIGLLVLVTFFFVELSQGSIVSHRVIVPRGVTNMNPSPWGSQNQVLEATVTESVYCYDFESGWDDWWTDAGIWEVGHPDTCPDTVYSGNNCAGTILNGLPPYQNSRLISPPVDLPSAGPDEILLLEFWHWFDLSGAYGMVQISVFDGTWQSWETLESFYGSTGGYWLGPQIDITSYGGSRVRVGFYYDATTSPGCGWYVDDICVITPHNVGVIQIVAPADTVCLNEAVGPKAIVRNFGTASETFPVVFNIGAFYSDTVNKTLVPEAIDTVAFESWSASPLGTHIIECYTALAGDENSGDDTLIRSVTVVPCETLVCTLSVADAWGAPGSTGNLVDIELANMVPVAGIQFTLTDIPNWLTATAGSTTVRTPGFTANVADDGTSATVLFFHPGGGLILPGSGPVLQLFYDVDAGVPAGSTVTMDLHDAIVSDQYAQPIEVVEEDGVFTLGLKGDVNGDGDRNILDIVRTVGIILGWPPQPPTPYELWAADCNCYGDINILDIIGLVNCILYGHCDFCSEKLAKTNTEPARIGADQVSHPTPNKVTVPIGIETPVPVAGLQLTLEYDSKRLVAGEVLTTELTYGFKVASRAESGKLTLLLYSTTGQLIPAGSGPVVQIPFKLTSKKAGGGKLHFEEVILAGENGGAIPVITKDAVLPTPLPDRYALSQNYPNPFNSATAISYQLSADGGQRSAVSLKIYNIEGQLVGTLVDGQQEAGYHSVRWDSRDQADRELASGIYFYRIKAGKFTETKKMILMR